MQYNNRVTDVKYFSGCAIVTMDITVIRACELP